MQGKYLNNKIVYNTPRVNYLTRGNWKDGFSGVGTSGGERIEYDILNLDEVQLEEGKWYFFELKNGKALILK